MSANVVTDVVRDLLTEAEDDYFALWVIPWELRRGIPDADDAEIRKLGEEVVRALVSAGLQVGDLVSGRGFVPWEKDDDVDRVLAGWDELGRDPNLNEVAWFALPDA